MSNPYVGKGWTTRLFAATQPKYAFRARTKEEFDAWQRAFRAELVEVLGLPRIESRGASQNPPQKVGEVEMAGYREEKGVLETEPGFFVPFYLLVPHGLTGPVPLVIAVHGHSPQGKEIYAGHYQSDEDRESGETQERNIGIQAVQEGYVALVPDMRAFGELQNPEEMRGRGFCRTLQMHAQLLGRTLVGERVWDVMRLLDYALTRPEVDGERVIITGNSGGGTVSLFAAAVDPRITLAAPGSYFCTFQSSIAAVFHCECNYIPGIVTLGEMYDVAGLIAPRPFLAINGREDRIFPLEGAQEAFRKLKEIYRVAGAEKRCELYIGEGGHRYYKARIWSFVKEWLG